MFGKTTIKAGETITFDCDDCDAGFSITFAPDTKDDPASGEKVQPTKVSYCPFCGVESIARRVV